MKDRKRQRENWKKKHSRERLSRYSESGYRDLTAYNAAERIRTGGKSEIVLK